MKKRETVEKFRKDDTRNKERIIVIGKKINFINRNKMMTRNKKKPRDGVAECTTKKKKNTNDNGASIKRTIMIRNGKKRENEGKKENNMVLTKEKVLLSLKKCPEK